VRILTVGNMYPPHHLGGYELLWQGAVRHLREAGHQVRVLASDYHHAAAGDEQDDDVHRDLRWYWSDHEFPRLSVRELFALERHNARVLERQLDELRPDVVSWWAMGCMSLSLIERVRQRRIPAVGFVIDDWLIYGPLVDVWTRRMRWLGPARRAVTRLAGVPTRFDPASSAHWVFASEATRKGTLTRWSLPRTSIAYCGIDPTFLDGAFDRGWSWRLLFVGRIDPRKGIDTAIEALARLPREATLSVVGDGDAAHLAELQDLARRLGVTDRVCFIGGRSRDALPAVYSDSDALIFPVRWDEPWGLVPLEAMARRRPVIATGSGGSGEYLRDEENCLLFARDDADALAAAVARLAREPDLRARICDGGLTSARRYTQDAFHAQVEAALDDAVRAGGRSRATPVGSTSHHEH
jgi:glycosyltransferase involved in cell wall biosynthesis